MTTATLDTFLRHLRRVVAPSGASRLTDAELLGRFAAGRDEAAFEVLLWRHGPMVLSVCRRLLGPGADAEDAFQATFLALVRKAAAIGKREAVGAWLYKVAYRVALRLRAGAARRGWRQLSDLKFLPAAPEPDPLWHDLRPVLDEEVSRLPERYRVPFVLCYLEGKTNAEAARELGCPQGTISSRLAWARERLRTRLVRRGVALSAATLAALLSECARAAGVPAALVDITATAALRVAAGEVAARVVSAQVAGLTQEVLRAMFLTKMKLMAALVLAVAVFGTGVGLLAHQSKTSDSPAAREQPAARPPAERADTVLRWKFEKDRTFYVILTTETIQQMKVLGNDVVQNQKQTFIYGWTPLKQEADKSWIIKQKLEGMMLDIDIGGNRISYDSTKPFAAATPLDSFVKALVGSEFLLTITPEGRVKRVEGRDALVQKTVAASPTLRPLVNQLLSEDTIIQMADTLYTVVPGRAVKKGDTWRRTSKLLLGPIGNFRTTTTYTHEGTQDRLDRIKVDGTIRYEALGKDPAGGGLPFKIKQSDLNGTVSGTVLFDHAKGRVERSDVTTTAQGKLTIEISGMETAVDLSQTTKTTVKTTETNPIASK